MKKYRLLLMLMGLLLTSGIHAQEDHGYEVRKNLDLFNRVYTVLDQYYVDTLHAEKLIPEAISFMLGGLDPYTEYIPFDDTQNLQTLATGKYAGVGALIRYCEKKDRCIVYEPYEGMPADKAGVESGDVILSIAGEKIAPKGKKSVNDYVSGVSNRLRGEAGSTFLLEVERIGEKTDTLQLKICRDNISMPAVPYATMVTDSIGLVKLTTFSKGCSDLVLKEVRELKRKGARSLILDLRDNGGGLAIEAVNLVNLFVPKGELILSMKGKYKPSAVHYYTLNEPEDLEMPLVVLVNQESASSSEITCGALQDLDRAVVMGERTYGKGLVQQSCELPYGSVLKVTTSHYYIPSGRCIQALDYSRRNGSGEVYRTPDSLTHVFYTKAGRQVRDGGGITPDIKSVPDSLPNLIYYLKASDQLQKFCSQYNNTHVTMAAPESFSLSEEDFQTFKKILKDDDFSYDRQTYKAMQDLRKIARSEGYEKSAKLEFEALEKKLQHDLDDDLNIWKKEIVKWVNAELCLYRYYRTGYYASLIPHDTVVKDAIQLLRQPQKYKKVLKNK